MDTLMTQGLIHSIGQSPWCFGHHKKQLRHPEEM